MKHARCRCRYQSKSPASKFLCAFVDYEISAAEQILYIVPPIAGLTCERKFGRKETLRKAKKYFLLDDTFALKNFFPVSPFPTRLHAGHPIVGLSVKDLMVSIVPSLCLHCAARKGRNQARTRFAWQHRHIRRQCFPNP
jgi:hypothetical protein